MSGKYDLAREAFGDGSLSWSKEKIVAQLVTRAYVFDAKHADVRALTGKIGDAVAIANRRIPGGWAKSDGLTFKAVSRDAEEIVGLVLRRDSEDAERCTLIAYLDAVAGFPMVANGGDIIVDVPEQGLFRV